LLGGPAYYVSPQPLSFPDPETSTPFYVPTSWAGFDYVVTSGGVRDRYLADPARFPVQCAFYPALERFTQRLYRTPQRGCTGPPIIVYRRTAAGREALLRWWAANAASFAPALPETLGDFQRQVFAQRERVLAPH
jgi:hypothetical protein